MHVFDQIDIQLRFEFFSKMLFYKLVIFCALLFASADADLCEIFDKLTKALKADMNLLLELGNEALRLQG